MSLRRLYPSAAADETRALADMRVSARRARRLRCRSRCARRAPTSATSTGFAARGPRPLCARCCARRDAGRRGGLRHRRLQRLRHVGLRQHGHIGGVPRRDAARGGQRPFRVSLTDRLSASPAELNETALQARLSHKSAVATGVAFRDDNPLSPRPEGLRTPEDQMVGGAQVVVDDLATASGERSAHS